jgi:uncharacterized protein (TIGR01777 family)
MTVVITGATGFIGSALCRELHKDCNIVALSRDPEKAKQALGSMAAVTQWNAKTLDGWERTVDGASAIINLAGENIASGRWNESKKNKILQSRLDATQAIVNAVNRAEAKPNVLIQASAIGYYGNRGDQILDESSPSGTGFLADVCKQWEQTVHPLTDSTTRLAIIRPGAVLGAEGGLMPRVLSAFRLFLGGYPGSGEQYLSWIHIGDVAGVVRFLIDHDDCRGVFNLTAPNPTMAKDFSDVLGRLMHRPSSLPVPAAVLTTMLGEMAAELLLSSQRVIPARLLQAGYKFKFPDAESALENIIAKTSNSKERPK